MLHSRRKTDERDAHRKPGGCGEQIILLMPGCPRKVVPNDQTAVKSGDIQSGDLTELPDCSVGLVGFGDIAKKTALLHHVFGVQKTCCTRLYPLTEDEELQYGVRYPALLELLAGSNIVSLHVHITKETEHLADAAFFGRMQEGFLFINTARGELVEERHWRGTLRREALHGGT